MRINYFDLRYFEKLFITEGNFYQGVQNNHAFCYLLIFILYNHGKTFKNNYVNLPESRSLGKSVKLKETTTLKAGESKMQAIIKPCILLQKQSKLNEKIESYRIRCFYIRELKTMDSSHLQAV